MIGYRTARLGPRISLIVVVWADEVASNQVINIKQNKQTFGAVAKRPREGIDLLASTVALKQLNAILQTVLLTASNPTIF